jgi:hypothetical protein
MTEGRPSRKTTQTHFGSRAADFAVSQHALLLGDMLRLRRPLLGVLNEAAGIYRTCWQCSYLVNRRSRTAAGNAGV